MALLFGFGTLFYVSLLLINAVAILHQDRFLNKIGMGQSQDPNSVQARIVNVISSIRTLLRFPLIALNILVIIYELLLG